MQLLVIMAMIVFLFPAIGPVRDLKSLSDQLHGSLQQSHSKESSSSSNKYSYSIVLDAGSTGSRIHIFKFREQGSQLQLLSDGFHQLKPGLSAFPDDPQKAAESLKPLMDEALTEVPQSQQVSYLMDHKYYRM